MWTIADTGNARVGFNEGMLYMNCHTDRDAHNNKQCTPARATHENVLPQAIDCKRVNILAQQGTLQA